MSFIVYLIGTLAMFCYLCESNSQPSNFGGITQRQAIICMAACLLWPLITLGFLWEKRDLIITNLRVIFEVFEPDDLDIGPEPDPETF